MTPYVQAFQPWQGVFSLLGTVSATLIGLLFVAASVGSGVYTAENEHGYRAFLSPTVVHFSTVLFASLAALAPLVNWLAGGLAMALPALFGLAYTGSVCHRMHRHGFLAGLDGSAACPAILAASLGFLLLIGIRNAWDMTMWAVTHRLPRRPTP